MLRTYVVSDEVFKKDFPCVPSLLDRDSGLSSMEICLLYHAYVIRRRECALYQTKPSKAIDNIIKNRPNKKKTKFIPALHYRYSLCTTKEA
jgi:hypothetical protein